jgi:hypothetical protein
LRRRSGCILSLIRFTPRSTGCSLLLGFARIHLPALIYAGPQVLRASVEAILGITPGSAGRRLDPAIVYALLSEPLSFGRCGRDCCEDQQS